TAFAVAEPFSLATVIKGPRLGQVEVAQGGGESRVEERGPDSVFVDALTPPPILLVFGAGDDAQPLVALAAESGFHVTIVDHRRAFLAAERFPAPARLVLRRPQEGISGLGPQHFAVVQTHNLERDRDWLKALLPQPLAYLGLLGPRARKEQMLQELGVAGPQQFYSPVGLDLGAEGPEQVAVSVVAEMLAVRARRDPRHLREKSKGIHDA